MGKIGNWFAWQTDTGLPLDAGRVTVRPISRRLALRWPGGGFLWQHPVAILVERKDGRKWASANGEQVTYLSIPDPTRTALLLLLGCSALALILLGLAYRRRDSHHEAWSTKD
jgi:hypothetical protein